MSRKNKKRNTGLDYAAAPTEGFVSEVLADQEAKEKKPTLRVLVSSMLESVQRQLSEAESNEEVQVEASFLFDLRARITKAPKVTDGVRKESKRYNDQIANPSGFLNRVMQQYTVQAKRKKLGLEPVSVSAAALTIAKAANELETIGAAL